MLLILIDMRTFVICLLVMLVAPSLSFSQESDDSEVVLQKANEVLYFDPAQAIKIGEHLKHSSKSSKESLLTNLLLAKAYLIIGNYSQAIASIESALKASKEDNTINSRIDAYLLAAEIYMQLNLFDIAKKNVAEANKIAENNSNLEKKVTAYNLFINNQRIDRPSQIKFAKSILPQNEIDYAFITKGTPSQSIANTYLALEKTDSALIYFRKSIKNLEENHLGTYWKMLALLDYSSYLLDQKDYGSAQKIFQELLVDAKTFNNAKLLYRIYSNLSVCSQALGNQSEFQSFRLKANQAEIDFETQTSIGTNAAFEFMQKEAEETIIKEQKKQQTNYILLGSFLLLLALSWLFMRWLYQSRINHASDIISYLKLIHKPDDKIVIVEKTPVKILSIPKETEDLLLIKLDKFEAGKKYLSNDISLAQMAALFETNTKYLSEVINKYKGKNVNLYINELRINYIVEKLKSDPKYLNYKVSYLAEECGFSSHSSFSAVFKNITGITPNVFITFLSKDLENLNKIRVA